MDKVHTPLSSFTLGQVKDLLDIDSVFSKLTDSQKTAAINAATQELADFLNRAGETHYYFDTIGDGDDVLAPVASSFDNMFQYFLHLKFAAYTGNANVVSKVSATQKTLDLSSATINISGELAVYTINLSGGTIDGNTEIRPPSPSEADIERVDGTSFKVYANKSHSAFGIWIQKLKEA